MSGLLTPELRSTLRCAVRGELRWDDPEAVMALRDAANVALEELDRLTALVETTAPHRAPNLPGGEWISGSAGAPSRARSRR